MHAAQGILTATGGKTSHAAVVARGWGKCCIVGCEVLNISYDRKELKVATASSSRATHHPRRVRGRGLRRAMPLVKPEFPPAYFELMQMADGIRRLKVRTNADTPYDSANAVKLGAEGIGLCRTSTCSSTPRSGGRPSRR